MSEKNKTKKHRQSQGTHKRACTSRTAGQRREIWLSQKKKKKSDQRKVRWYDFNQNIYMFLLSSVCSGVLFA